MTGFGRCNCWWWYQLPPPGQPAGQFQSQAGPADGSLETDSDTSSLVFHVAYSAMIAQPTGPDNLQVGGGWLAGPDWGFWKAVDLGVKLGDLPGLSSLSSWLVIFYLSGLSS